MPTSAGAKTSAGRKLPTFTSLTSSSFRLIPMMRMPPALVSAASASLPSARMWEKSPAASEMPPWTTRIVRAANATPGPSEAASAMDAKPSSSAFVASASWLPLRPSWIEPTTVSGPTQNSRLAVKNASLTVECGRPRELHACSRSPTAAMRSSMRSASPAIPPSRTPPSTYRGLVSLQARPRSTPMTIVVRPRPASTRRRRRCGRRGPTSHPTSLPRGTGPTLMNVPVMRGPQHGTGRDNAARMPRTDVLLVSLGSTGGLRAADAELRGALERAGATVAVAVAAPQRDVRTMALTDLVWARAARAAARAALREHEPRAVLYSTTTAALLWPVPGAIRFDAPAASNRPGRHGVWQRPVERRRLRAAPLLVPWADGSLVETPAPHAPAVGVPIPVEPSAVDAAPARDIAAIAY